MTIEEALCAYRASVRELGLAALAESKAYEARRAATEAWQEAKASHDRAGQNLLKAAEQCD